MSLYATGSSCSAVCAAEESEEGKKPVRDCATICVQNVCLCVMQQ